MAQDSPTYWKNARTEVRAAGFDFAESRIVFKMLVGTCSKVSGSIDYEARPFDSDRIAVA